MGALLLLGVLAFATQAQETAAPAARLESALGLVRASREDLDVRPGRWDTRLTSPAIEATLSDPLELPARSSEWGGRLASAEGSRGFGALAETLLGLPTEPSRAPELSSAPPALPPELGAAAADLAQAIALARPFLAQAASAFSGPERRELLDWLERQLRYGPPEPVDSARFDRAGRFDAASLLQAFRSVAEAADRAAQRLADAEPATPPRRVFVAGSTVTLGGPGDDVYAAEELAGSDVLIDLGGRNRYEGPPAAAGPGEIRVVIDLGREAIVESSGPVASGRFGIGILLLPNAAGAKRLRAGDFALGAGLFGAGLLRVRGAGSALESGEFSQGAAAFGVGALEVEGDRAELRAPYSAQGFAFTRGVGLLRVRGRSVRLACGLSYPDAREPLAAISLCQGVGYGPRAFAAGGFGLARVESSDAEIESNYFAQGSGYWHSFGGFWLRGDRNRVRSRRYGQGAGVHTALGAFECAGDGNRIEHWGVGEGYGWDWGVGYGAVAGDRNELYADWAAGRGDVNGHGFAWIRGRGNRLRLPDLGTGALKRTAPSYGVAVIDDPEARVWAAPLSSAAAGAAAVRASAWGVLSLSSGAVLGPELDVSTPTWRTLERERAEAARRDRAANAVRLAAADAAAPAERVGRWLFVASSGGLDGRTPQEALERLLALDDGAAARLPALVSPERFDELTLLRALLPAYGPRLLPALRRELAASSGLRKALLLGFFRWLPAAPAAEAAASALRDPDRRVRREALGVLGAALDRESGEEPGRLRFLEEAEALCRRPEPSAPLDRAALDRLAWKRLADLWSVLALDPAWSGRDRVELLRRSPTLFDPVPADVLHAWAAALGRHPRECLAALRRELGDAKRLREKARRALAQAAEDPSPDLLPVALAGLGQIGEVQDAPRLAAALEHPSALVREAAAAGLARLGPAGRTAIERALAAPPASVRGMGALAAAQSWDADVVRLVGWALDDRDEDVRGTAVSALYSIPFPLLPVRKEFVPRLARLAAEDPSPSVRATAALAFGSFR